MNRREGGLSLIELMISIVIVVVGIISLALGLHGASRHDEIIRENQLLEATCQNVIAELRTVPFSSVVASYGTGSGKENFWIGPDKGLYFSAQTGALITGHIQFFNTAAGPSQLAYVGSGKGTGNGNDLTVKSGTVMVNPNGTENGLLTILGIDCDFNVNSGGVFGQAVGDPNNAGYSQIISLGGNTSSDEIMITATSKVYGRIYAAAHALTMYSNSFLYGSVLTRTGSVTSSTIAIDEGSIGIRLIDPTNFQILARWPASS